MLVIRLPAHRPPAHEQEGRRPALVIGLPERLGPPRFPTVIVAPLTTAWRPWVERAPRLYPVLEIGETNLPRRSVVLMDQCRAVDVARIDGWLGT